MISRIWRGWTRPENADTYETLLREEIFPGIAAKDVEGYREIQRDTALPPPGWRRHVRIHYRHVV